MKEKDQKKKDAKKKGNLGSFLEQKRQSAPSREAHSVRTEGKEPELLETIPYEFMAW